jgi:hypothetical protein
MSVAERIRRLLATDSRSRRLLVAAGLYVFAVVILALVVGDRLWEHTPYNHYAHLADAWLHGRQDLANGPPPYAGNNDFALFHGKTYISFPPFPAVLMLPLVALAGSPENFRDAQFIVWLAGLSPAFLFLVLEKLRRTGRSDRTEIENVVWAFLLTFGTVFFFSAVQGTVWFAAHVVCVALMGLYVLFSLDGEHPWLAGLAMACMWMTRPTTLLTTPFFLIEAFLASSSNRNEGFDEMLHTLDRRAFGKRLVAFAVPVALSLGIGSWMNFTRFGNPSPTAFGHEFLTVGWQTRIRTWGLFSYHYLAKNLGVMLTLLPYPPQPKTLGEPLFRVNQHGLALWFTTPFYVWILWPKERSRLFLACVAATLGPLVMNLLYQNSGWSQFGYRFSNDYVVLLFVMLALCKRPMKGWFWVAAVWAVGWNLFGAMSFERAKFANYYFHDGSQSVVYQPD